MAAHSQCQKLLMGFHSLSSALLPILLQQRVQENHRPGVHRQGQAGKPEIQTPFMMSAGMQNSLARVLLNFTVGHTLIVT